MIRFNYMSHADDWAEFRACVRLTRQIFNQPAFAEYRGDEIQPGAQVNETIPMVDVAAGLYLVRVRFNAGETKTLKVTKF